MKTKVFYDLWQMECCGIPFKIGDSINWLVTSANNIISSINIEELEYVYDANEDDWKNISVLKGIVKEIFIYYEKFELV